jgi:hypothetical protein
MRIKRESGTWQEYLGALIANPQEKQRLEQEVRIQPVTFQRWITGKSRPREGNIRQLLHAIPEEHYASFHQLVIQEFPGLEEETHPQEHNLSAFPVEFFTRVLSAHANTPPALFRQALFDLILQQAIQQFDPDRQGTSISLVCCVPPRAGSKIRSLRQVSNIGTPPWKRDDVLKMLFLGSESLAGAAVTRYRRQVVNSKDEAPFTPIHWTEYEESAGAFPIARQARIAGCLIASSARPSYFTEERQDLLECCASLLALAFEREDFFDPDEIALGPMPLYTEQEPFFRDFSKRVSRQFVEAQGTQKRMNLYEARQKVWQDIEEEMLHRTLYRPEAE